MYVYGSAPWQLGRPLSEVRERLVVVEVWSENSQIPSEQATRGQWDERRQQEVGDSVEVERSEGHGGDGQRERQAGRQRQQFTGRDEAEVSAQKRRQDTSADEQRARAHLFLSLKVLQLISSMYTIIRGTRCGQQGSGSSWVEYLQGAGSQG